MSSFWPADIQLSDTQSPSEILKEAQEDWQTSSNGVMDLILQVTESQSGNSMIIVNAKHVGSSRTAALFSVVHRREHPYPVAIQIEEEDLPNFLKKSYYKSGSKGSVDSPYNAMSSASSVLEVMGQLGRTVSNEWVADTPPEFRKKLATAFNLGAIKGEILNLASVAGVNGNSNDEESLAEPGEV